MYPIVLISEAKLWKSTIRLSVVRNLLGVVNDLRESLPGQLMIPTKWPSDLYGGSISANYLGAIFTNGVFSTRAEAFAFSHGIFLVPTPIKSSWIDKLMDKLTDLHTQRRCSRNCVDKLKNGWNVLDALFTKPYHNLDDGQRETLVKIFQTIIENCPIFGDLNSILSSLHFSRTRWFTSYPQMDMEAILALHDLVLEIENKKNKLIKERRMDAFSTWFETEFGLAGKVRIGEIHWPIDFPERKALDEEKWTKIYEIEISFTKIQRKGSLLLSRSVVDCLKKKEMTTLSIPFSRGLIAQISLALGQ